MKSICHLWMGLLAYFFFPLSSFLKEQKLFLWFEKILFKKKAQEFKHGGWSPTFIWAPSWNYKKSKGSKGI